MTIIGGNDCNDELDTVYPGATEYDATGAGYYDGLDSDCIAGLALEEQDLDGDGYIAGPFDRADWKGSALIRGGNDCDDENPHRHPDHPEECDGINNDCDAETDEDDEGIFDLCIVVDTLDDAEGQQIDSVPGNGQCDDIGGGACSLRAAIMEANALPPDEIVHITFDFDELNLGGAPATITLNDTTSTDWMAYDAAYGNLYIARDLHIINRRYVLTITGNATRQDRLFHVGGNARVVMEGLQLRHGHVESAVYPRGGAILNNGHLTLRNVEIDESSAHVGGGIFSGITDEDIYGQMGIPVTLFLHQSKIHHNDIILGNPDWEEWRGAGVAIFDYYDGAPSNFFMDQSAIYDNNVDMTENTIGESIDWSQGGGLFLARHGVDKGNYIVHNSTIAANRAHEGGALFFETDSVEDGSFSIQQSTFVENESSSAGGASEELFFHLVDDSINDFTIYGGNNIFESGLELDTPESSSGFISFESNSYNAYDLPNSGIEWVADDIIVDDFGDQIVAFSADTATAALRDESLFLDICPFGPAVDQNGKPRDPGAVDIGAAEYDP